MLQNVMAIDNGKIIGIHSAASGVSYDNTDSGLTSTNVQDAIDEVSGELSDKVDKVAGKGLSTNDYDNTAKGIVDGVTTALAGKVSTTSVGSANGVAELDANGKVPSSQLPSYVDDVVEGYYDSVSDRFYEESTFVTVIQPESGKSWVDIPANKSYRWTGSVYVRVDEGVQLGETSDTAYAGNKGKANADAITAIKNGTSINSFSAVETALAGKANSSDLGDKSNLTTTDKSSAVAAINELVSSASLHSINNNYTFADLTAEQKVTWFTNWTDNVNFPVLYGSGVLIPAEDPSQKGIIYVVIGDNGNGEVYTNAYRHGAWEKWNGPGLTYGIYQVNNATDVKDFIKKAIQQAHTDLANKKAYTLYNILATYIGNDNYYGTVERQDTAAYVFSLSKANGDNIYHGYYDISSDYMNVFRYDGTAI